jgi:hypothetical protein
MPYAIAPGITDEYIKDGWNFEKKVHVFQNRVLGWQLKLAGDMKLNNVPDRGYAQLMICLSYFEMIARYREGNVTDKDAGKWFVKGIRYVFDKQEPGYEGQLVEFYKRVRNGLYHIGMTRHNVWLTGGLGAAWKYQGGVIWIDPDELVASLCIDLVKYSARIQEVGEVQLRTNFIQRFNYDNGLVDSAEL